MTTLATDPEHIAISKTKGVTIDWRDGHHSEYPLGLLRDECPCATCTGAHGTRPEKTSYSQPPANPFQMYQAKLRILNVEQVGHYAVQIQWSDGHGSGIYSFDHFRRICPCAECRAGK